MTPNHEWTRRSTERLRDVLETLDMTSQCLRIAQDMSRESLEAVERAVERQREERKAAA